MPRAAFSFHPVVMESGGRGPIIPAYLRIHDNLEDYITPPNMLPVSQTQHKNYRQSYKPAWLIPLKAKGKKKEKWWKMMIFSRASTPRQRRGEG
jgi:hypothetical protein